MSVQESAQEPTKEESPVLTYIAIGAGSTLTAEGLYLLLSRHPEWFTGLLGSLSSLGPFWGTMLGVLWTAALWWMVQTIRTARNEGLRRAPTSAEKVEFIMSFATMCGMWGTMWGGLAYYLTVAQTTGNYALVLALATTVYTTPIALLGQLTIHFTGVDRELEEAEQ